MQRLPHIKVQEVAVTILIGLSLMAQAALPDLPPTADRQVIIPVQGSDSVKAVVQAGPVVPIAALAFSPDGKTLAQGAYKEVLLWDLEAVALARRLGPGAHKVSGIQGNVQAVTFFKDGRRLAASDGIAAKAGSVRIYDLRSMQETMVLVGPNDVVYCLSLDPNEKELAAGGADGKVYVWGTNDGRRLATIDAHGGWVQGLAFSPDANNLATVGADRTLRLWETRSWTPKATIPQPASVHDVRYSPDGQFLAIALGGPQERSISIQRADNPRRQAVGTASTGAGLPLAIAWTAKPNRIYAACSDGTIKVIDAASRRRQTDLIAHDDWVYSVAISPDGTKLASGSADGTVKLWTTADNRLLATLVKVHPDPNAWAIVTSQGYFTASSAEVVQWRSAKEGGSASEAAVQLNDIERVRAILAGKGQAKAEIPKAKGPPKAGPGRNVGRQSK